MVKMNFTSKQAAFEYALYMIAASYFDKAVCLEASSQMHEKNLLLQYKEQKQGSQIKLEDICIAYMDELEKKLPKKMLNQQVEVRFSRTAGKPSEICFLTPKYRLCLCGVYAGKDTRIEYKFFCKTPDNKKSEKSTGKRAA